MKKIYVPNYCIRVGTLFSRFRLFFISPTIHCWLPLFPKSLQSLCISSYASNLALRKTTPLALHLIRLPFIPLLPLRSPSLFTRQSRSDLRKIRGASDAIRKRERLPLRRLGTECAMRIGGRLLQRLG